MYQQEQMLEVLATLACITRGREETRTEAYCAQQALWDQNGSVLDLNACDKAVHPMSR